VDAFTPPVRADPPAVQVLLDLLEELAQRDWLRGFEDAGDNRLVRCAECSSQGDLGFVAAAFFAVVMRAAPRRSVHRLIAAAVTVDQRGARLDGLACGA
jgi:hypothetical protein